MSTAKKIKKQLRYMAEALLCYFLYGFFKLLGVDWASATGGWILRHIGPHLAKHKAAQKHLQRVFPDMAPARQSAILSAMWDNLGRVFAEYPHLHKLGDRFVIEGKSHLNEILNNGEPAILIGGHFANWEAYGVLAAHMGMPLNLVYRRPNNMYVDKLLIHARSRGGAVQHIPKDISGAKTMAQVLKDKQYLGILLDQKFNEGVEVPFFGETVRTAPYAIQMARRFDCPVYAVRIERTGGAHFKVSIESPLNIKHTDDAQADVSQALKEVHEFFESWISTRPEQWLWLHNRWTSEPKQ